MLKVVVFDSGYGGELFADYLSEEIGTIEVIRVIDWRNAEDLQKSARLARKITENTLRPYLGQVDLIVFANYLLSVTSLKYFRRKYKKQKFVGLTLPQPDPAKRPVVLTTAALSRSKSFRYYSARNHLKSFILDDWPILIDDGELGNAKFRRDLKRVKTFSPATIVLACSQFSDLLPELRRFFGHNLKIIDGFEDTLRENEQILGLRGILKKKN